MRLVADYSTVIGERSRPDKKGIETSSQLRGRNKEQLPWERSRPDKKGIETP